MTSNLSGGDPSIQKKMDIALSAGRLAWWDMYLPSGKVEFNEQKVTMLGYDPSEFTDITFHDFMELVHPDDREASMQAMRDHITGLKEFYDVEYRIKAKDGSYHWYYDRGAVTERDGENITLRGVVIDVTDWRDAQKQLRELNRTLEAVNAEKDQLFSIIAHDLRNPFTPILGYSEHLKRLFHTLPDEKKIKFISGIHDSARTTHRLLENLLTWARSQRGVIEVNKRPWNLSQLFEQEIMQLRATADDKKIELINEIPGELELTTDADLLGIILRNLLSNALKFTNVGGAITIRAELVEEVCRISVKDTGIGMPEKIQENLYRFTHEIIRTGTSQEKGSGLGIKLCRDFAEKLGGSLSFVSSEGKGTVFYVEIPCC